MRIAKIVKLKILRVFLLRFTRSFASNASLLNEKPCVTNVLANAYQRVDSPVKLFLGNLRVSKYKSLKILILLRYRHSRLQITIYIAEY